ncbi:MAG TPA: hypothetical protein VH877_15245 [Polyangia bacterium]|jgi:hypothetical protein|nr:hypothetical protein [Polyangia bacterium]
MDTMTAVSAFAYRSARRGTALQIVAYSIGLTAVLLLVAAWICGTETAATPTWRLRHDGLYRLPEGLREIPWEVLPLADLLVLGFLVLALLVVAPAAVAAAVASERRAGTLDQLRATPLSAGALLGGLIAGAPARVYLLCAGPLVFHAACGVLGVIAPATLVATLAVLATGTLASVLLGLAAGLAPRSDASGTWVALCVAGVLGFGGVVTSVMALTPEGSRWAFFHPAGALAAALVEYDGLGRRLLVSPWNLDRFHDGGYLVRLALAPLWSSLAALAMAALLYRACCRKLVRPHLPTLSKGQALLAFVASAAALVLPLGGLRVAMSSSSLLGATTLGAVLLLGSGTLLVALATPSFELWALGLRQGRRGGWWEDAAAPHGTAWLMLAAAMGLIGLVTGGYQALPERGVVALGWTAVVAASVPCLALFWATRYSTAASRWGWGAALVAYLVCQVVAIVLVADRERNFGMVYVQLMAMSGLLLPAWVVLRQHFLRRATLSMATARGSGEG